MSNKSIKKTYEQFAAVYDKGLAVGFGSIKNDTMIFNFNGEVFTFPAIKVHHLCEWTGYFYVVPVETLRKLEAEAATG